jgi:transcriptional regulator with XRE-family HTH domain
MKAADVNQSELARRLGIKSQAVNQWLQPNGTIPKARRLTQIAAALGVPLPVLMDWAKDAAGIANAQQDGEFVHDPQELLLLDIWREIDDRMRVTVMEIATALLKAAQSPASPPDKRNHRAHRRPQ